MTERSMMEREYGMDLLRRLANVVGAIFQVGMTAVAAAGIRGVVDERTPLIEPALYAFFIWGVIFTLSLAYAVYQSLPSRGNNPLLRRVGWFTAAAFFCTGLWSVFVPARQLLLALLMLTCVFAFLLVAYLRVVRSERGTLGVADRWLVALPTGVFLGWITAANAVSVSSEAVRFGLVEAGGVGEALLGSGLLLVGAVVACGVILASKNGPPQGYLAYGVTVLWALVAIVVNQYDASLLTTAAAALSAAAVAFVLFGAVRGGRSRRRPNVAAWPGAAR